MSALKSLFSYDRIFLIHVDTENSVLLGSSPPLKTEFLESNELKKAPYLGYWLVKILGVKSELI